MLQKHMVSRRPKGTFADRGTQWGTNTETPCEKQVSEEGKMALEEGEVGDRSALWYLMLRTASVNRGGLPTRS